MIKKLLLFFALLSATHTLSAQGTFTVFPASSCYIGPGQNTFTATVSTSVTATSYSWASGNSSCSDTLLSSTGSVAVFQAKCCGIRTLAVTFYSGSSVSGTAAISYTVHCPPTINAFFAGGNNVCAGTGNTLIATGGMSYSIAPANIMIGIPFTTSSSACYTVGGSSSVGCMNFAVACLSVSAVPSVSISPVTPLCLGQIATLTASGANTYTWSNSSVFSTIIVTPSVTTCYSVIGTNAAGCTSMASTCVSVSPLPTVFAISNPASPICQGDPAVLMAGGAMTYTWYPTMISAANATVYPPNTTNFTVAGYDGTCTAYATVEVTVLPAPILMTSNSYSMCLGTSVTMTASGATSYTWMTTPPVNTATINVMPSAWTMYTVTGTGSNGCGGTMTVGVYPDPSCAIVWPGDANSDGVVNSTDVFELGLYASSTGGARTPGGNSYTGQYATAWTGTGSNSQNKAHIDCNGDGTVDQGDTLAITSNFSMTHSFKSKGASSASDDITLTVDPFFINYPQPTKVNVFLGSSTNVKQDIYGVAFDLHFDESMVKSGTAFMTYPSSFLNAGNQNIPLRLFESGQGVIHCVSVRTDGVDVDGFGKIAEFHFENVLGKPGDVDFSVTNVQVISATGQVIALSDASISALPYIYESVNENSNFARWVSVYPNPAIDAVTFDVALSSEVEFSVVDLTGRIVMNGKIKGHYTQDISSLSPGTYILNFKSPQATFNSRLIKE